MRRESQQTQMKVSKLKSSLEDVYAENLVLKTQKERAREEEARRSEREKKELERAIKEMHKELKKARTA